MCSSSQPISPTIVTKTKAQFTTQPVINVNNIEQSDEVCQGLVAPIQCHRATVQHLGNPPPQGNFNEPGKKLELPSRYRKIEA